MKDFQSSQKRINMFVKDDNKVVKKQKKKRTFLSDDVCVAISLGITLLVLYVVGVH